MRPTLLVRTYPSSPFNSPTLPFPITTTALVPSTLFPSTTNPPASPPISTTDPPTKLTPTLPPSRQSKTPVIVGGIFGGVAVAAISTTIFFWICGRRKSRPHVADYPISTSESMIINPRSGPMAQEQAPMVPSASSEPSPFFSADTGRSQSAPRFMDALAPWE